MKQTKDQGNEKVLQSDTENSSAVKDLQASPQEGVQDVAGFVMYLLLDKLFGTKAVVTSSSKSDKES